MKQAKTQPALPVPQPPMTTATFGDHARGVVAHHGTRILAEVPTLLRRVGTLFLVLAISIPAFCVGLLIVLWHLGH